MDETLERWATIALRYNTAMSRAMLRAIGIPIPKSKHKVIVRLSTYSDLNECFANNKHVNL